MLSRRRFIGGFLGTVGSAGLVVPLGAACDTPQGGGRPGSSPFPGGAQQKAEREQPGAARAPQPFTQPLRRPPVLRPVRSEGGTDYYEMTARVAQQEILPGLRTEIFGYNGIFPGPTLDVRRGQRIVVTTRNELPVPIVNHLHGGRTPPWYGPVTPGVSRSVGSIEGYMNEPSSAKVRSVIINGSSRSPCGSGSASSSSSRNSIMPASPRQICGPVKSIRWSWYHIVAARWSSGYA